MSQKWAFRLLSSCTSSQHWINTWLVLNNPLANALLFGGGGDAGDAGAAGMPSSNSNNSSTALSTLVFSSTSTSTYLNVNDLPCVFSDRPCTSDIALTQFGALLVVLQAGFIFCWLFSAAFSPCDLDTLDGQRDDKKKMATTTMKKSVTTTTTKMAVVDGMSGESAIGASFAGGGVAGGGGGGGGFGGGM